MNKQNTDSMTNAELAIYLNEEARERNDPKKIRESHQSWDEILETMKNEGINWRNDDKNNKKMNPNICTELLLLHTHVIKIGDDSDTALLGVYNPDTGLYDTSQTAFHQLIRTMNPTYTRHDRGEVISNLKIDVKLKKGINDKYLMPLANGIYDIKHQKLLSFSHEYIFTSKIATAYPVNGVSKEVEALVDEFLGNYRTDEEFKLLLLQIGQEAMNPNHTHNKMIFLKGYAGSNGKSTYEELLINTIGEGKIASLTPSNFSERFATSSLVGKVANIADDIDGDHILKNGVLKSVTTGNAVNVEKKGGDRFTVHFKTALIFSCNNMPNFEDKSGGLARRLLILPFKRQFSAIENIFDEDFTNREDIKQCFLKKCLDIGLFEQFIEPDYVREEIDDFLNGNDYIRKYIIEEFIPNDYHLMKDKKGNKIPIDKIPANFIRNELKRYKENNDDNTKLTKGYAQRFAYSLQQQTGIEYEYKNCRINSKDKRFYPKIFNPYIEAGKGALRAFVKA